MTVLHLKDYLFLLLENGLLSDGKSTGIYKTTERGLRILEVYNDINEHTGQSNGNWKRGVHSERNEFLDLNVICWQIE